MSYFYFPPMKVLFKNIRTGKRQAKLLDLNSLTRKQLENDLDSKVKPALIKSHELIVANWKSDVSFASRKFITGNQIAVSIYPTGPDKKIWTFVDQGTRPHQIPAHGPVKAKAMKFQAGGKYQPKTLASPARTASGGGKVSGGTTVFAKTVKSFMHPGNKGRHFSEEIAEDIQPGFIKIIEGSFRIVSKQVEE
jgi:hypothetical protein